MNNRSSAPTTVAAIAPMYCLGDSHVSFFAGEDAVQPGWPQPAADRLPWFRVFHLGPTLAFSLSKPNTTTQGRERLFEALTKAVPAGARVLLCFGEIDCRAHILKQAAKQGRPVADIVAACLDSYFQTVQEVQARGYEVIVYNAVPTRLSTPRKTKREDDYIAVGSWQERNAAVRLFNAGAKQRCQECGVKFLENYLGLVNAQDKTESWFFFDAIHLSQRALPPTLRALAKLYPEAGYPELPLPQPTGAQKIWDRFRKRLRRWLKLT
ncbi:MAG: hypothetical protein QM813_23950 [Verrucomicrobiota bacterium]